VPAPGVPPSPATLGALVERMRAGGVRVVIAEPYADPSLLRRLTETTGARVVTLVPSVGGDEAAADYIPLFDLNVQRLVVALTSR
jgi:ABC-type Zn uptake system ZnuABC Zn-binding protein ZnuA